MSQTRKAHSKRKISGNVVMLDVTPSLIQDRTPWEYYGRFKDNPFWAKVFDEIEQSKNQSDSGLGCLSGKTKILGDIVSPVVDESEWEVYK
jgi:hypothetical protein